MIQTQTPQIESAFIIQEVRKWKEEHAAQYGFDIRAIGKALQEAQKAHPERVVSRQKNPDDGKPPEA